jgi:hypothetical protein
VSGCKGIMRLELSAITSPAALKNFKDNEIGQYFSRKQHYNSKAVNMKRIHFLCGIEIIIFPREKFKTLPRCSKNFRILLSE